ncbi:MAG: adenosylcobalamin-dependent ribonucleoside-diphosphate reductase [Burkholderiales bacterium]|nr:adenosylcobalamin-dependent ribonucleoside-diphosphate reductase [Burkholderiales bacterium]OJX03202.1 MAG: ribonucleoside-diphosphate reductase, adenosylcobalamin-dependent [Burkholderiales bacterium 70-64]
MKIEDLLAALPEQEVTIDVLREKYAKGDESSAHEVRVRVARALASVEAEARREHWQAEFLWAMENGFVPAGRINSAAGTDIRATLINCFVQPIGDAVWGHDAQGTPGIYAALQEAAETMRRGGGVGYDFSSIRPRGALVKGTLSRASGPVSYMRVFDKSCETLESAGSRRGAQMGVMRVDHPDVEEFINAKNDGSLTNFNMSVAVTHEFMRAVESDGSFQLVHAVQPFDDNGAGQNADGAWIYRTVRARDLWDQIMHSTYDHAEPGVIFIDRVNQDNNLSYCEAIAASNPCGEQFLPPYGCCDLGSMNLTRFIADPFGDAPSFDYERFRRAVTISVRALDNVLDLTMWPLQAQEREAQSKRRIGLGFTGLGNALTMMKLRYDSEAGRAFAAAIAQTMRDVAYEASVALAQERGAFPLFDAEAYLAQPHAAARLPETLRERIRQHGIRNSHLLSIAPTGTISIAFAGNASGGIEPAFSWTYTRRKRMPDGSKQEYEVEDFAYRLWRHLGHDVNALPDYFVSAMQISALDHMRMSATVQPYIDSAISKTVNVAEDYPYEEFKSLYLEAWRAGLKGITTYRPNSVIGSVLSVSGPASSAQQPQDLQYEPDRRLRLERIPQPALSSLRWPSRPKLADGNMAYSYMVEPLDRRASFCIFIGQTEESYARPDGRLRSVPFETWVNGNEQPRGLGAIAKALSMDMRSNDRGWLKLKLDALALTRDEQPLQMPFPPTGEVRWTPGIVAGFAEIVRYRCEELGVFEALDEQPTPMLDAMMFRKEPKSGPLGTLSWTADVSNAATGDDFVLGLKELQLPDGTRRPYSIWLSGDYPRVLDGLCKLLSIDMYVIDVNWIGLKLRKLLSFGELNGSFWAPVPGEARQQIWPSTVAYVAALLLHRFKVLGLLDDEGHAVGGAGALALPDGESAPQGTAAPLIAGQPCPACGTHAYIKRDGCMFCTACGHQGECG